MLTTIIMTTILTVIFAPIILKSEFKKIKLDVSIDDMKLLEKRIKQFFTENNLPICSDIETIAKVLNIKKGGDDPDLTTMQARLSSADKNGIYTVTFKPGLGYAERLFAFAHECAHVINQDQTPVNRPDGHNKPLDEQLADYTAAALLMPYDEVNKVLITSNYAGLKKNARIKVIKRLCKQFDVSDIIALRRVNEVIALNKAYAET